jgi:hypothetical protein
MSITHILSIYYPKVSKAAMVREATHYTLEVDEEQSRTMRNAANSQSCVKTTANKCYIRVHSAGIGEWVHWQVSEPARRHLSG